MPTKTVTLNVVIECVPVGDDQDADQVREAVADWLDECGSVYVQDEDHDDESEYLVNISTVDLAP